MLDNMTDSVECLKHHKQRKMYTTAKCMQQRQCVESGKNKCVALLNKCT